MPITLTASPDVCMPHDWQVSTVARHIDNPFSAEALAEPYKTTIDLGEIDHTACRVPGELQYQQTIKTPAHDAVIGAETSEALVTAHSIFLGAAFQIVGPERYRRSQVDFEFRQKRVWPGSGQVKIRPHLDSHDDEFKMLKRQVPYDGRRLGIVGIAHDRLPTVGLQGPTTLDDFHEEALVKDVRSVMKFTADPLPTGRLILAPPSLLHIPTAVPRHRTSPINRLFMRWHLTF